MPIVLLLAAILFFVVAIRYVNFDLDISARWRCTLSAILVVLMLVIVLNSFGMMHSMEGTGAIHGP